MDSVTSTQVMNFEIKSSQENTLFHIIKQLCFASDSKLSSKLIGKVIRIIGDCDLTHHSTLRKPQIADKSIANVLGFMSQIATELTYDEQTKLNEAIVNEIETILPIYKAQLDHLQQAKDKTETHKVIKHNLYQSYNEKAVILKETENEKVDLMMQFLNHRLQYVSSFTNDTVELLTLKTQMLHAKSRIAHLNILQNIYLETNDSIKAFTEVHKDLTDSIKETQQMIKDYEKIIKNN